MVFFFFFLFSFFFLYWFFPYCSQSSQLIQKHLILEFQKNMTKPSWISCWVWWNQMFVCLYWIFYTKMYSKTTTYVNELILTLFSPFDIKYRNLMRKTSGNVFLGHLGWWVLHIFPRLHSILGSAPDTIFVDHLTIFNLCPVQDLRWSSFWQNRK